jgi:hypothetical protein
MEKAHSKLREAQVRLENALGAMEKVNALLVKADERLRQEPDEARKWSNVLENLEKSLDEARKRANLARMDIEQLEASSAPRGRDDITVADGADETPPSQTRVPDEDFGAMSLEEAGLLQGEILSGDTRDERLEAGLEYANQLGESVERDGFGERRQLVLRSAIEKIQKRRFNRMSFCEVKLLLDCHSLLTRRLSPSEGDLRLRRILDGSLKVLRRKRDKMESGE